MAASAFIFLIALLGCCGARKEKKRYLLPYILLVFVALAVQVAAAYFIIDFDSAMAGAERAGFEQSDYTSTQQNVMDYIRDGTTRIYERGDCGVTLVGANPGLACGNPDAQWFENFVNGQCRATTETLAQPEVVRCIAENGAPDAVQNGVYCVCRSASVAQLKTLSKPLIAAAVVLMLIEALVLVFACRVLCSKKKQSDEDALRGDLAAPVLQPADNSGALYRQHGGVGVV